MFEERRVNRSTQTHRALELQLVASAERAEFSSLTLSEQEGLLVAGTGEHGEVEEIAALSPHVVGEAQLWHGRVNTSFGDRIVTIIVVDTPDGPLYLSGVGGSVSHIVPELMLSSGGVSRILS